jgi:hypothetical protein
MQGQKKEIFLRRRTINGQTNRALPLNNRLILFTKILNSLPMSRAFDSLYKYNQKSDTIVMTAQGKVDKNLFDYLLKRNETSFTDLRSRSPMGGNKSIYSRYSRSRTPVKGLRKKRRKGAKGSTAGQSQMDLRSKKNLYMSQNLNQNPKFFKLDSNKEVPLSTNENQKNSKWFMWVNC